MHAFTLLISRCLLRQIRSMMLLGWRLLSMTRKQQFRRIRLEPFRFFGAQVEAVVLFESSVCIKKEFDAQVVASAAPKSELSQSLFVRV